MSNPSVKLVGVTLPCGEGPKVTPEAFIAYMARVSNPEGQQRLETAERLLHYMVANGHWSPFDMVDMVVELETTRGIMPQVLRHWSFRFQEFSQRYADAPSSKFEHVEGRLKAEGGNRQGSSEVDDNLSYNLRANCARSQAAYEAFLEEGASNETARFVLTLATPTRAYMKGSVRSWMTYFWQRLDPHCQKEHRQLAWLIFDEFEKMFPKISALILSGKPVFTLGEWTSRDAL